MNAKGFFLPDGQRPSKRDLLDLQCVRGRQYFFFYSFFNIYFFYIQGRQYFFIFIPFLIFIFSIFIQGRQYEHSGVCALLEQVDKKGGFC